MRCAWLALVLAACGGYSPPAVRTADRARATVAPQPWAAAAALPDPRGAANPSRFAAPAIRTGTLANGIRTVYLERHDLPIVSVTFGLARGRVDEQPGATRLLLEMLRDGPKSRKPRFSSYFGWLGAPITVDVNAESSSITFETLSNHTTSVVLTAGEMFLKPSFDDEELDEEKRSLIAELRTSNTDAKFAGEATALATIGLTHHSDPSEVDKLMMADVERAYKELVAPDAMIVAAVGDFTPEKMDALLVQGFAGFSGKAKAATRPAPLASGDRFIVVDRAKGEQSTIVIVTPAPRITDPDAAAFDLACGVLRRRLWDDTRQAKGYTYGGAVSWDFDPYMQIVINVSADRTKEALQDVLSALESAREGVKGAELVTGRSAVARYYSALFRTNTHAASTLASTLAAGASADAQYKHYDAMRDVKPEDVTAAIQKWMAAPHVVIVGDATAITGDVSTVGLGSPVVRSMN